MVPESVPSTMLGWMFAACHTRRVDQPMVLLDELEKDLPTTNRKWVAVIVAALVILQLIFGEGIVESFDARLEAGASGYGVQSVAHIAAGLAIGPNLMLPWIGVYGVGLLVVSGAALSVMAVSPVAPKKRLDPSKLVSSGLSHQACSEPRTTSPERKNPTSKPSRSFR